jgi:hypothetical protein
VKALQAFWLQDRFKILGIRKGSEEKISLQLFSSEK